MTILQTGLSNQDAVVPAGYQIERSLRFNSADSASLSWTPAQAGNQATWTWSGWVKRSSLGSAAGQTLFSGNTSSTDRLWIGFPAGADTIQMYSPNGSTINLISASVFRDPSAWYHVVIRFDTTQATASNRVILYVNGVQQSFTGTSPGQNTTWRINSVTPHYVGQSGNTTEYFGGYITEVNFIDGQALTPSDFGETSSSTGVWTPKAYTGSYGNNGFYLPFNDNSTVLNLGRNRQTLTADPYFPVTTLLLNGNGTNGAQNNTFLDSSSNNFTITRNGNTTQGTFSPFSQTGWGNYFDGSGDYLTGTITAVNNTTMTMECWVWLNALDNVDGDHFVQVDNGANTNYALIHNTNGSARFLSRNNTGGTIFDISSANSILQTNKWHHIVGVRNASAASLYVDGTRVATVSSPSVSSTDGTSLYVASNGGTGREPNGYISNARIVSGTAVYDPTSSSLTVPTSPLTAVSGTRILTCQSNRFVDNSGNNVALTINGTPSVQAFSPFAPTVAYSAATNGGSGYFDGSGDYLVMATASAAINTTTSTTPFTIECWVYNTGTSSTVLYGALGSENYGFVLGFGSGVGTYDSTQTPWFGFYNGSWSGIRSTTAIPRNAWTHLACVFTGSTSYIYQDGVMRASGGPSTWGVTGSSKVRIGCRVDATTDTFTGYISGARVVIGSNLYPSGTTFTPPTAPPSAVTNTSLLLNFTNAGITDATGKNVLETVGNAQISTTQSKWGGSSLAFDGTGDYLFGYQSGQGFTLGTSYTVEMWLRLNSVTGSQNLVCISNGTASNQGFNMYMSGAAVVVDDGNTGGSGPTGGTLAINTWYHIAIVANGTNTRLFIDGVLINTYAGVTGYGGATAVLPYLTIGISASNKSNNPLNGFIDDLRITRGLARYTGNFTVPQAQFAYNQADINVKQWVPTNFSVTAGAGNDSLVDSPTNYGTDTGAGGEVRGNYCTFNALQNGGLTLANGNLDASATSAAWRSVTGTLAQRTGKFYFEVTVTATTATNYMIVGVGRSSMPQSAVNSEPGATADGWGIQFGSPAYKLNNGYTSLGTNLSYVANDVLMVAVDVDAGKFWFGKNGTWILSGDPATGANAIFTNLTGEILPMVGVYASGNTGSANFGQRPFAYTAPSGFKALCTTNLPTPAIGASASTLASKNFNVVTYTGTGGARTITGVGFQPDLVWNKERSATGTGPGHRLLDSVRGSNLNLSTNTTAAEYNPTSITQGGLGAVASDGFTIVAGTTGADNANANNATYVAWNWKANGAGVSNTAGTITSTVSANTAAGISVVGYTGNASAGATVGHGLGVAPKMIIVKSRTVATTDWRVWVAALGNARMILNDTSAAVTDNGVLWGNGSTYTAPTSSVFTISANASINTNAATHIAYCFAEVAGFSKFGSYTGNASTDGPFVFCGFRPRWILVRRSDAVENWILHDTARDTYNVSSTELLPNSSAAETATTPMDILSNGFKVRSQFGGLNASGGTYIYAAFAEAPFNYARAR